MIADPSTKTRSYFEFSYEKLANQAGDWFHSLLIDYDCDIFPRFYGFGNNSSDSNQSSYTSRERNLQVSLGYRLAEFLELAWYERYNLTSLSDNHLPTLPATGVLFPGQYSRIPATPPLSMVSVSATTPGILKNRRPAACWPAWLPKPP